MPLNEIIFFIHIGVLAALTLMSLKLGKTALSCLITLMSLSSNLFVLKQINLFGLTVTAADAYAICGLFSLNLLQEYFGKESAKKLTTVNFFCLASFSLLSMIHLYYQPAASDWTQLSYQEIFNLNPRIMAASFLAFFLSQQVDIHLFGVLRKKVFPNSFAKAACASSFTSQALDTVIFSFSALYGQVESMTNVILFSLVIKYISMAFMAPLLNLSKKLMRT